MPDGVLFGRGTVPQGWGFTAEPAGGVSMKGVDRRSQEDSRQLSWNGAGPASALIRANPLLDLSRETTGQLSLVLDYRVDSPPTAPVTMGMGKASVPVTAALRGAATGEWRTLAVPLGCFERGGADMAKLQAPLVITTSGRMTLTISDARILSATVPQDQCGAP
jgi:beta-glucosidase